MPNTKSNGETTGLEASVDGGIPVSVEDIQTIVSSIKTQLNKILRVNNYECKTCGTQTSLKIEHLSMQSGYWTPESGKANKPYRFILHLYKEENTWIAKTPTANTAMLIGYINARAKVQVVGLRVIVAVKNGTEYIFPDWEWLLFLCFDQLLDQGTSGEPIDHFDPDNMTATYQSQQVKMRKIYLGDLFPYATATALPDGKITYGEASEALSRYFSAGEVPDVVPAEAPVPKESQS
jgi:hypothetical protein